MEAHEIRIVTQNLSDLILNTTCSEILLAKMEQAWVFQREDVEAICAQPTPTAKSRMFYNLVVTRRGAFSILMQSLEETNQTGALQTLKYGGGGPSTSSSGAEGITGVSINVVAPLPTFTGRKAELTMMHDQLARDISGSVNSRRIITITGLGGVGKTQLCRRYVQLHGSSYYNKNVVWLNAESKDNLSRDFLAVAQEKLKLESAQNKSTEVGDLVVVEEVYNFFRNRKCLFVYDNIEKGAHLKTYLPLSTGLKEDWANIHFILTSRVAVWGKQYNAMKLNVLDATEAVEMIRNIIGGVADNNDDDEEDSCLCLINEMQSLPLALHQAVAFIREEQDKGSSFGISDYLREYRSKKELCLSFADSEGCSLEEEGEFNDYKETVLTTWQITIDKMMTQCGDWGDVAIQVLECIAYFHPDRISTSLLATLHIVDVDRDSLREGIALLIRYSLVNITQGGQDLWSVHRLVLEVMRLRLKQACREESVLRQLLLKFSVHGKQQLDNITNIFMYSSAYDCLMSDFEDLQRDVSSEILLKGKATSLNIMMCNKWEQHNNNNSTLGQVELSRPREVGGGVVSRMTKLFRMAALLNGKFFQMSWSTTNLIDKVLQGDNKDKDRYLLIVIRSKSACTIKAVEEKLQDDEECDNNWNTCSDGLDRDILLMFLHLQSGDLTKSLQYFKNVLIEAILEDDEFDDLLNKWGKVFMHNAYHLPPSILIKSLAHLSTYLVTNTALAGFFDTEHGENGVKTNLEVFGMIGTALSVLGYHKNAIKILSCAYRFHKSVCHIDSLHSLLRLADALRRKGDLLKSRELYEFAHGKSVRECGEGSEFIFEAKLGLSELLSEEGKYEEALGLLQKLHEDMTRKFGMTEEYYIQMVNVLRGKALRNLGRHEDSLALLQSIPDRFGDRIGWQFLPSQSLAKEIQSVERRIKRQKLVAGVQKFFLRK